MKKSVLKTSACTVFLSLVYQLVFPICSYALTTGPSQPEVQSFEPVGTTEMVNMFSGDFNYNIPLLDVEGYPVNIAYHSGIGIEQEASWCGLGWNINPGEINRSVRGLPDDFNGENIEKTLHIEGERNYRFGTGANVGLEFLGALNLSLGAGIYINFNNYKGIGVGMSTSASASAAGYAGIGMNMGVGSQTGADIDLNANVGYHTDKTTADNEKGGFSSSLSAGTGFNSRTGLKDLSFGVGVGASYSQKGEGNHHWNQGVNSTVFSTSIPIGMQNFVPVVTNSSTQNSYSFQIKLGGELFYAYPNAYFSLAISSQSYATDGTRKGYGYMYYENANDSSIVDFSRDKESTYNKTVNNLPASSNTYDIYTVSGQGTGGMFRPYRNDIGTSYDPSMSSKSNSFDVLMEAGVGNLFEAGMDMDFGNTESQSGPWKKLKYGGKMPGTLYEKLFFKQGGELTYNDQQNVPVLYNDNPEYLKEDLTSLKGKNSTSVGVMPYYQAGRAGYKYGNAIDRTSRANLLTCITAAEADDPEVAQYQQYSSFNNSQSNNSRYFDPTETKYSRYNDNDPYKAHGSHVTEFTQTTPDGKRNIYGIPAMNNVSREVSFNVNESKANISNGMVSFSASDASAGNQQGREHFYSSSITPAYAHSYLLTSQLSADYVDIMGDGPTDDDLGSFVKFNYTLKDADYRWRAPFNSDSAQYNPGYWSDFRDGKGNFSTGSRQVWLLRAIETKNYIAEYYTSAREDGKGTTAAILNTGNSMYASGKSQQSLSYELDSIKLYNKHDRYINEENAIPVKTVIFRYSYRLCPGTLNSTAPADIAHNIAAKGKLTLEKIYFKYGNSEKNLLSPYSFSYSSSNPAYDFAAKDRWGNYKQNNTDLSNYEFPYTSQQDITGTDPVTSWNLTDIKLPSGGVIHVDYESDDYAYVQNRRATQMFKIAGVGNSTNLQHQSVLYQDASTVNDYVYFERNPAKEHSNLSPKENYLEGEDLLYYNFDLDITGTGRYEHIGGYAKIDEVGYCTGGSTSGPQYGYVKLKREQVRSLSLHPATVYGLNIGRYYLPHIFYPGFSDADGSSAKKILTGLIAAARELSIWTNPFSRFIKDKKGRNIVIAKSWIRLQSPNLAKKGGGIRVKRLTLDDKWNTLTANPDNAQYGKEYDYTIDDPRYGTISSGVATYEPFVGGDENPFRKPVPYTADAGRLLPAIEFFQEEPFGEPFFPGADIGYSRVSVKSIHFSQGRSSRSEDESLFYTAKDFPLNVDYTQKETPEKLKKTTLKKATYTERVLQGYSMTFNDMHGKPREVNNYVINASGNKEKITGIKYNYVTDPNTGKLSNTVKALVRQRGTMNNYNVQDISLGKEVDFSVDSRSKYFRGYNRTIQTNINVVAWGPFIVGIPTMFFPDKENVQTFSTMVSTKIIQQYGVVKSTETYDHGAKTLTENLIYDAETGNPMLTKTNNQYDDNLYNVTVPAHLAYERMAPAYLNQSYESVADSFVVTPDGTGYLYLRDSAAQYFVIGDEIITTIPGTNQKQKLWITYMNQDNGIRHLGFNGSEIAQIIGYKDGVYRCALIVAPRYKRQYAANSSVNLSTWPTTETKSLNVPYKIIRSGRRNNLDKVVQQTTLTRNPFAGNAEDLFDNTTNNGDAFNNMLSTGGTSFSDTARGYDNFGANMSTYTATGFRYENFNAIVLGIQGNFRPHSTYVVLNKRDYITKHSRYDGTFSSPYNLIHYSTGLTSEDCYSEYSVLYGIDHPYANWKKVNEIIKYDVYGNAIEERDAIGNYSSAVYGYNKQLPVAVSANTRQHNFFFDGFEDYNMLIPEYTRRMYIDNMLSGDYTDYRTSPFAYRFNNYLSGFTNATATDPDAMIRYGQRYNLKDLHSLGSAALYISNETAHTGNYSLKCGIPVATSIPVGPAKNNAAGKFIFTNGQKYLVSVWIKPFNGATVSDVMMLISGSGMIKKTGSIEGWYLLEGVIDLTGSNSATAVGFYIPTNYYVDDLRILPIDANMKSFVYDPFTFRLTAELDENHFASFYEYDQEGQLVRVKKETEKGILTVSESRRANSKLQ